MDNTQKFSGLANEYTVGRPAYAKKFIESLYSRYGFLEQSVIADIGSGTGKFARQLLEKGSFVYCVEPNGDMQSIAKKELGGYKGFRAVDGTASETKLDEKSVDFITAAQAFHWFDVTSFKKECQRILRDHGLVLLIWNTRDMSSGVNQDSYAIYSKYCPDFKGFSGGIQKDDVKIRQFFDDKYEYVEFDNPIYFDKSKFISRSLSGSYSLREGDENYGEYLAALYKLFETYAKENVITMANKTAAYIGSIN